MPDKLWTEPARSMIATLNEVINTTRGTVTIFIIAWLSILLGVYLGKIFFIFWDCDFEFKVCDDRNWQPSSIVLTIFANALGELSTTMMAMFLLGAVLVLITGRKAKAVYVQELHRDRICQAVIMAASEAASWHYRGGTGAFLRARTLPTLKEAASKREEIKVCIIIANPTDNKLCDRYAQIHHKNDSPLPDKEAGGWSGELVKLQCLATILSYFVYAEKEPKLAIEIYLTNRLSHFRYDMSDTVLIVTRDHPSAPGIKYPGIYFRQSFCSELKLIMEQSIKLKFPDYAEYRGKSEHLTPGIVKELLSGVKGQDGNPLRLIDDLNDEYLARIINYTVKQRNPYT